MGSDYRAADSAYLHLGPFSRHVICKIDQQLDEPQPIEADPRSAAQQPDVAILV
jgi:hypothetical protein